MGNWEKVGGNQASLRILIINVEKQSRKSYFPISLSSHICVHAYTDDISFSVACKYFEDSLIIYVLFNLIENGRIL